MIHVVAGNSRNERDRSRERSPLRPQPTSYGSVVPIPGPSGVQPPPPCLAPRHSEGGEYKVANTHRRGSLWGSLSPSLPKITGRQFIAGAVISLVLAKLVAFSCLNEARGAMRKEAKHLEIERIQNESSKLENERIALETVIRLSKLERARLEKQREDEREMLEDALQMLKDEGLALKNEREMLEDERKMSRDERLALKEERERLEDELQMSKDERLALNEEREMSKDERKMSKDERLALKEERERWEKAREDRVPQGAFWESVWPAEDCRSYGKREYWGVLRNIPEDWTDIDACMNMPAEIKGVTVRRPHRCHYVEGSPHIHGFWMVDWNQLDCKPWHQDFNDKVSLAQPWVLRFRIQLG